MTTDTPAHDLRSALELCVKVIEQFKKEDLLAEGIHAGLRKGTDAPDAHGIWNAIAMSSSTAWGDAIAFALDPYFTMWGGDKALAAAKCALASDTIGNGGGDAVHGAPIIEWIVELARRDIMREQTDFIGRMHQALGDFEFACEHWADGEVDEASRDDAGEALAGLAGLALAQLVRVSSPSDPLSQFAHPPAAEPVGLRDEVIALRKSLRALLDACYQADGAEELPDQIDGSLLDAASDALELQYPIIWTDEQVAMLEGRQADASLHPYTCGGDRTDPAHVFHADEADEEAGLLFPTVRGWKCPACDYRQFWSHETSGPTLATPARIDGAAVW